MDKESRCSLELWAQATHRATIFEVDGFPVLAVKFGSFTRLGGANDEVVYSLPNELYTKMRFMGYGESDDFEGYLETEALGLPSHHAFFVITSRPVKWFEDKHRIFFQRKGFYKDVKFKPHYNSFCYNSQKETISDLQDEKKSGRWHPLLRNQRPDLLKFVDMTADGKHTQAELVRHNLWLMKLKPWNTEQLKALATIHKAAGGVSIIMGIAGTGKTLLQSAMCMYFAQLGYKCIIATPANTNADHSTLEMSQLAAITDAKLVEAMSALGMNDNRPSPKGGDRRHKIRVHRLYPSSRNYGFRRMTQEQASHRKQVHVHRNVSTVKSLEFKLHGYKDRKVGIRDLAIERAVIDEADTGELHLTRRIKLDQGDKQTDVWDGLRKHLQASREGTFDWNDKRAAKEYESCYEACKNHIVALTNVMVTTTGNARSDELLLHWTNSDPDYGVPFKGVIVFLDEAAKDLEINTWMPIVAMGDKVRGVFMFGDEK